MMMLMGRNNAVLMLIVRRQRAVIQRHVFLQIRHLNAAMCSVRKNADQILLIAVREIVPVSMVSARQYMVDKMYDVKMLQFVNL